MDEPVKVADEPSLEVTVSVESNSRFCVEAATVVTHGDRWSLVDAPGPALPAEAATKTPAAYASRNASSVRSVNGVAPPPTEKFRTLTPSRIDCCTAAAESLE